MPKTPNPKKASSRTKTPKTTDYAAIRDIAAKGLKKHGKAKNTTDAYDGYIRRGKDFLRTFTLEESEAESRWKDQENSRTNLSTEGEEAMPSGDETKMHPQFRDAFDGPPLECTPLAIAMFMADKCLSQECGKSTASAIHAAFLRYYNQMYVNWLRT